MNEQLPDIIAEIDRWKWEAEPPCVFDVMGRARDEIVALRAALQRLGMAVLRFHSGEPWTEAHQHAWSEWTGTYEATSRTLCDLARAVLKERGDE